MDRSYFPAFAVAVVYLAGVVVYCGSRSPQAAPVTAVVIAPSVCSCPSAVAPLVTVEDAEPFPQRSGEEIMATKKK